MKNFGPKELISILQFCPILENYIDGSEFLKLTDRDIRDMIPAVGIAKKIGRLVPKVM